MTEYGVSLGSNWGDRAAFLREARARLAALPGARLLAQSRLYETQPVDVPSVYAHLSFLNAVLIVEAEVDPPRLAADLHAIETALGRVRTAERNAPRPADLDLIYAGSLRIRSPGLTVPHPRWRERRFVVQPLADVRPDLRLPGETRTVREVLESLPPTPAVALYAETW